MKKEHWLWAGIMVIFFGIAFFYFRTTPAFWFDEGIYYQIVKNWAGEDIAGVQLGPGNYSDLSLISVGYSVLYPAVILFKIFGASVTILRLTAIAFLCGLVFAFYFLAKKLYGTRNALLSLLLLVTFSPLYGNGKSFLGEVPGLFFLVAGLYFFTVWEEQKIRSLMIMTSGLFLGLAIAAKPLYILILPALGVAFLFQWRYFITEQYGRRMFGFFSLGIIAPLFLWVTTQFGGNTSLFRIFSHYSNPYYITNFTPIILNNLQRFITESTPIHFLLLLGIAMYYFGWRLYYKQKIRLAEVTAVVLITLILIFYLRTVGWYRYFFPAHVLLFMFLSPGLGILVQRISGHQKMRNFASIIIVFLLVCTQAFPLSKEALSVKIDASTALQPALSQLNSDKKILFYSVPQIAARYSGKDYYQYLKMSDYLALGTENVERLNQGWFDIIFIEESVAHKEALVPFCYERIELIRGIEVYQKNYTKSCI